MDDVERWTEHYILNLPPENDHFDCKQLQTLMESATAFDKKRDDFSKHVSAFANSGGGLVIHGVSDDEKIDGGVPRNLKNGTYNWLDILLPDTVDPILVGCKIHVIEPTIAESAIKQGNVICVIEVPDSEAVPHQARAKRYYFETMDTISLQLNDSSNTSRTDVALQKWYHF